MPAPDPPADRLAPPASPSAIATGTGTGDRTVHRSLADAATVVGGYAWIERRLASVTGGWAARMALPAVQVHLAAQSARHGWHAELWAERLPRLDGVDPDGFCRPPSPAVDAAIAALDLTCPERARESTCAVDRPAPVDGGPGVLPLLAGLYRVVLPRLVVSYQAHLGVASPVSDGPVIRALRLVLADETDDWRDGELMVQQLMVGPGDADLVHTFLRDLETGLVRAGLHPGLTGTAGD